MNKVLCLMAILATEAFASLAGAAAPSQQERLKAMNRDKLGVFIHWGLYSILGDGEWVMDQRRIPKEEYNKLADVFRQSADFSPREWVRLAKKAGARYCVFTTRHHDGFVLWDTRTTDFNSVKTAAGRDYVREFCEACREEGLRVGLYYSLMNWQYWNQRMPYDKKTWDEQVCVTVEGLRELMTNYGQIDYLWYDGCWGSGTSDVSRMLELWPSVKMNAMARRLQPGIVINDRAKVPEDFSTPEQRLEPPPRGRAWETCLTVNQVWGYRSSDNNWKSSEELFRALLHCARFGGNLLVNIGPRADGSVPEGCVKSLEGLGRLVAECPKAIYGSERDEWTEATREAGVVTKVDGVYYLWALNSDRLDGVETMHKVAPRTYRVTFRENVKPCHWIGGRHDVVVKAGDAPVLAEDKSICLPPEGLIERVNELEATQASFVFPGGGEWRLDVGYVRSDGFKDTLTKTVSVETAGDRTVVPLPVGAKGVYAKRMTPLWKCRTPKGWQIAGMIPTEAMERGFDENYLKSLLAPENVFAAAAKADFGDVPLEKNALADDAEHLISMTYCAEKKGVGYSLARTTIVSDRARTVYAAAGCDWWWRAFVNGEEAVPFTEGNRPKAFPLRLKKGVNEILLVFHCGLGSHFARFFDNLPLR